MRRGQAAGRSRWTTLACLAAVVGVGAAVPLVSFGAAVAPLPGAAGTDTSLPATDSAVTIAGRGDFASLRVTVNQTRNLANQALSITWTGGAPTTAYGGRPFGENFLQMFQCWGDDDGTNADNPGPPPTQCQQGATIGTYGGSRTGESFTGEALTRVISQRGAPNFDPAMGTLDEFGSVSLPFRAVDGTVVPQWRDTSFNPQVSGGNYWLNPYFNIVTTNEIAGARTADGGTGADLFEATTGLESTGLGCGQRVQRRADGSVAIPRCWLVIVPRGSAATENDRANISPSFGVGTSPLAPNAWRNRIAVPLGFNPVDSSCALSADQRRIVGTELLSAAVSSWQPTLCATPGLSPYAYGAISDGRARQQLLTGGSGGPGMAVMARPIDPASLDPENPVVYAPLTVSGTVIGFNVERLPKVIFGRGAQPPEAVLAQERALAGIRLAGLNLTPRLVAKLLTQSYRTQVEIEASRPGYAWSAANPQQIGEDPDFIQFNPEFALLRTDSKNMGGLVVAGPNSDAAQQLWEWVLADPEARTWLSGTPDTFGMKVNPVFSTDATTNPQGTSFGDPVPDSYPKSDPYCYRGPDVGPLNITPPPLCGLDWLPYSPGLREAARSTRAGSDGARTELNPSPASADQVYKREPPQALGARAILSVTDTASAHQYGVQMARLSRAGDNGTSRSFVAPDAPGLAAGVASMSSRVVPSFLEPAPAAAAPAAYPLTAITYAAITPLHLDQRARTEYAAFVDYAAGPGQVRGFEYGKLPAGYEPMPAALAAQAKAAAVSIRTLSPAATPDGQTALPSRRTVLAAKHTQAKTPAPQSGVAGATAPAIPSTGAPASVALPASRPRASLSVASALSAVRTPVYRWGTTRYALPLFVVLAMLSGLGALEVTKLPRRARSEPRAATPDDEGTST